MLGPPQSALTFYVSRFTFYACLRFRWSLRHRSHRPGPLPAAGSPSSGMFSAEPPDTTTLPTATADCPSGFVTTIFRGPLATSAATLRVTTTCPAATDRIRTFPMPLLLPP